MDTRPAASPKTAPLTPPLSPPLPPPPPPSAPPPIAAVDRLVLAIHDLTRPQSRPDRHGIGDRLRRASVGAADLLSRLDPDRADGWPRTLRLGELAEGRSRLAEVAYYVDLGERLGTFNACEALELFELGLAASVDLAGRLDRLIYARTDERPGRLHVQRAQSSPTGVATAVENSRSPREAVSC